jgi:hypothetical protein
MTFLAPWWLGAAAAMAAAVVALHLLARRRPRVMLFPTARFIPDRPATAASLATRPTDLPLLLLRVLLLLLLGTAFARPVVPPPRRTIQIILLDQSPLAPMVDSASAQRIRSADVVIPFDGSLSAALVAALRAAPGVAVKGDSLALTIISPFAEEEFDDATFRIREQWKGGIALVPVSARQSVIARDRNVVSPDDPLAATLALLDPAQDFASRLVRGRPGSADTAWARQGGALILWPRLPAEMSWPRGPGDTVGGVSSGNQAVVAAFHRDYTPPEGSIAAVWADGGTAATTIAVGKGCVRNIAIAVPDAGDLVLRPAFLGLSRALLSPCAGWVLSDQADAARLDSLRGPPFLLPSVTVPSPAERRTPANPWLLLGVALLFAAEPLLRRRKPAR